MSPPDLCAKKISTDEGGLSQSPPFFLCRAVKAAMALIAQGYPRKRTFVAAGATSEKCD
jgi:hypothetical protein